MRFYPTSAEIAVSFNGAREPVCGTKHVQDSAANAMYEMAVAAGATQQSGLRTWWGIPGDYKATYVNSLHDYCTSTPGGAQDIVGVDMKGPCARHDQCLERRHNTGQSRLGCDHDLRGAMQDNCIEHFSWYNIKRAGCQSTAAAWAIAVIANTLKDWVTGGKTTPAAATIGIKEN